MPVKGSLALFLPSLCLAFCSGGQAAARSAFPRSSSCRVQVVEVLEAENFRGPPYLLQILTRDPEHASMIESESHGDHHLTCTYKILLNQRPYRYKEEISNTLLKLKEEDCNKKEIKKTVVEEITGFTDQCRNPTVQPAWGEPLEALSS